LSRGKQKGTKADKLKPSEESRRDKTKWETVEGARQTKRQDFQSGGSFYRASKNRGTKDGLSSGRWGGRGKVAGPMEKTT